MKRARRHLVRLARCWLYLGAIACIVVMGKVRAEAQGVASIVIDAASGHVLEQKNADVLHYPASLTKLMTLYLVFDALKSHRLTLDQTFRVSRHAASREPTKLGLKPGTRIAVRDLILGLVTESANDAASVLAEGLAGTEAAFAERMTQQAEEIGMTRTVFRNASGLPNRHQVTTAHDMARLARALITTFPDDYKYFSVHQFRYGNRIFLNHDRLIYSYDGMDGMKTGFTNAARFNLVSSALRHGRRLIGVVLGSPSPVFRDRQMVKLLDDAFSTPAPQIARVDRDSVMSPLLDRAGAIEAAFSPIDRAEAAPPTGQAPTIVTARKQERHWGIQVGVFARRSAALSLAKAIRSPKLGITADRQRVYRRKRKGHALYHVQFIDFDRPAAVAACHSLLKERRDCIVFEARRSSAFGK